MEKDNTNPSMKEILDEKDQQTKEDKYNQYVKNMTPTHNWILNLCNAFVSGGIICTIGQVITNILKSNGMGKDEATSYTILILVLLSIVLTGLNLYNKLAKFAGAGSVVPITGFANSVASPAIEFKKEGQVFGIGCKIFTIAGPVILYGIFSSFILGLIYYILKLIGIV